MANRPTDRSVLRYPLDLILGSLAHIRILRELSLSGQSLSAPDLARRTGLSGQGVRNAIEVLEALNVVQRSGLSRGRTYSTARNHMLVEALLQIFKSEADRWERLMSAAAAAAMPLGALAIWIYGSVARGEDTARSDLDLVVVVPSSAPSNAQNVVTSLFESYVGNDVSPSTVVLRPSDVTQLVADNDPWWRTVVQHAIVVAGDSPDILGARLARRPRRTMARR